MSSGNESCSSVSENATEGRPPEKKPRKNSRNSVSENTAECRPPEKNPRKNSRKNMKRENYISWNDYFMGIAFLAAHRSKDPRTQVGACIVSEDNKIVGVGYNGMPGGNDDDFPWERNKYSFEDDKLTYVCHAEMNAFMNAIPKDTKNCYLYVTRFPCNECAKIIIQAKIKKVIYCEFKGNEKSLAAQKMFDTMNIKCSPFKPDTPEIRITLKGSN